VERVLVVDVANVVGSVPDGWWRDRAGAARRLRDALAAHADTTYADEDIVLVVEGKARGVESVPNVRVVAAEGSGDDTIVDLVAELVPEKEAVTVVTADRGLRQRIGALGAGFHGPGELRSAIGYGGYGR
jgi:hypothetical protein